MGSPWDPKILLVTKNSLQSSMSDDGDGWRSRACRTSK